MLFDAEVKRVYEILSASCKEALKKGIKGELYWLGLEDKDGIYECYRKHNQCCAIGAFLIGKPVRTSTRDWCDDAAFYLSCPLEWVQQITRGYDAKYPISSPENRMTHLYEVGKLLRREFFVEA